MVHGPFLLRFGVYVDPAPPENSAYLLVECLSGPRLDVVCHDRFSIPTLATDDHGTAFLSTGSTEVPMAFYGDDSDFVHEVTPDYGIGFRYRIPLRLPPNGMDRLARIKGVVHVCVATKWQTVTVDYPPTIYSAPSIARLSDGRQLTVANVNGSLPNSSASVNVAAVRFEVLRAGLSEADWSSSRGLLSASGVSMEDGRGRKWKGVNRGATLLKTYERNGDAGPAARVVIDFPIALEEIKIPYDLSGVRLP